MKLTVGLTIAAFVAGFVVQGWRMNSIISDMEASNTKALAVATAQVMEDSNRLQRKKDAAIEEASLKAKQNAVAASNARDELEWVREYNQRNSTAISTASCTSVRDYATTATTVFGECATALEDMARKAQGHALDARTLIQAWPTNKDTK